MSGEVVATGVAGALTLVSKACRSGCVRDICESLEDVLMMLLDEAGEAENVSPLAVEAVAAASEALDGAAGQAEARGCLEEARLLREAAKLLERLLGLLTSRPS